MTDQPFRVFVPRDEGAGERPPAEEGATDWSADEIEQAYRQALGAIEAFEAADTEHFGSAEPESEPIAAAAGAVETPAGDVAAAPAERRLTPRQIIEAVLFVGGEAITSRKLCGVLRDEFDVEFIERTIDELNGQYLSENRPYEIRLADGGYRMELRGEFAKVRHRVFGLGPKEVKLGQDALEVLALIAYRQPISKAQVEEAVKKNPGSILSQLVRRELIAIERSGKEVSYRTTSRFLQLFGLGGLDDLPQAEELTFK